MRPRKQEAAELFLKKYLSNGRRPALDVIAVAKQYGFGEQTLNRVKARMGIVSEGRNGVWYWRDVSVQEPETIESINKIVLQKLEEIERLLRRRNRMLRAA
jgi:hypothetical protein